MTPSKLQKRKKFKANKPGSHENSLENALKILEIGTIGESSILPKSPKKSEAKPKKKVLNLYNFGINSIVVPPVIPMKSNIGKEI